MSHDDHFVYVFVRQDISLSGQLVHAAHAAYHMGNVLFPVEGLPSLVMIGTPHVGSLAKIVRKLKENDIKHFIWSDPDTEYGPTAIATEPISHAKKDCLANYRLWAHSPVVAPAPTATGEAKAAVAQSTEHPTFSREVGGSIPSSGSNIPHQGDTQQ